MRCLEFGHFLSQIPPTQLVDRSYSAYISTAARAIRNRFLTNPTNGVGGSFILSLHLDCRAPFGIVFSRIPPTELVVHLTSVRCWSGGYDRKLSYQFWDPPAKPLKRFRGF